MFTRKYFRFIFSIAPPPRKTRPPSTIRRSPHPVVYATLNQTASHCATVIAKVRPGLNLTHLWLCGHLSLSLFRTWTWSRSCSSRICPGTAMSTAFNQSQRSRHKAHAQQVVIDEWVRGPSGESCSKSDDHSNRSWHPCSKHNRAESHVLQPEHRPSRRTTSCLRQAES